ncbi:glycerol-3-phosphate dehydrogenase subunit GlpB [Halocalculus aciditolerans]
MTAALAAARDGASVRLLSHTENTLRQASGLIDVLGYTPDGVGPLPDPFDALSALPDAHPYTAVGEGGVRDALALFDDVTGATYEGGHTARNALVPTFGGRVKPTARYPASTAAGLASREADALLVGFESLPDFDAPLAADRLAAAGVPFDARGVTVSFPGDLRADAAVTRYARALDADEETDDAPARAALATAVAAHLDGESRVGFPAILGDEHAADVRATLEGVLAVDVFEIPTAPPSLPGLRLEDTFHDALRDAGVTIETGNPVVGFDATDDRLTAVHVDHLGTERAYGADAVVLATGGLIGKGVETDRAGVREPIFDCHVPAPDDRYDWFRDDAFGDHPFARFGVRTDDALRPLDETGTVEFENLYAAGSVLGGYDFAAEKSGSGVSLATGYAAGRGAANE